jgi:hypothetical protein
MVYMIRIQFVKMYMYVRGLYQTQIRDIPEIVKKDHTLFVPDIVLLQSIVGPCVGPVFTVVVRLCWVRFSFFFDWLS